MSQLLRAGLNRLSKSADDYYGIEAYDQLDRQVNDDQLRKAISYLAHEGNRDSTATYMERIQLIGDDILERLPASGEPYDHKLFKKLRSMVREVQNDFDRVDDEESSSYYDSDFDIEEPLSPQALYRGENETDFDDKSRKKAIKNPLLKADVLKTQFLYGGPDNEVEDWHQDFPAVLPFGENLFMQEWEDLEMKHDLAEAGKRLANSADPIVDTNVPYEDVEKRFARLDDYDSGSRFQSPSLLSSIWNNITSVINGVPSSSWMREFNESGNSSGELDYTPRLALYKVSQQAAPKVQKKEHRRSASQPNLGAGTSAVRKTSRVGGTTPKVIAGIHNQSHQRTRSLDNSSRWIPQQPPTTLKKFQARRAAAAGSSTVSPAGRTPTSASARVHETPSESKRKVTTPISSSPVPATKRPKQVSANASRRGPGRPPIAASTSSSSAKSSRKRKLADSDETYAESPAARKAKKSHKEVSKQVAFIEEATFPSKKASPKQSNAVKKAAAKEKIQTKVVTELTTQKTTYLEKPGKVKRGTTRSGAVFKPSTRK